MRREEYSNTGMNVKKSVRPARRRRRLTPFGRFVRSMFVFLFISMIILGGMRVQAMANAGDHSVRMEKIYTSVEIHPGDTLWSMAKEYGELETNKEIRKYVKEIKEMNHIYDESSLTPGAYILLYSLREVE